MGTSSDLETCPNCGKETFYTCHDSKTLDFDGDCTSCGYYKKTVSGFHSKEELKELKETMEG